MERRERREEGSYRSGEAKRIQGRRAEIGTPGGTKEAPIKDNINNRLGHTGFFDWSRSYVLAACAMISCPHIRNHCWRVHVIHMRKGFPTQTAQMGSVANAQRIVATWSSTCAGVASRVACMALLFVAMYNTLLRLKRAPHMLLLEAI